MARKNTAYIFIHDIWYARQVIHQNVIMRLICRDNLINGEYEIKVSGIVFFSSSEAINIGFLDGSR